MIKNGYYYPDWIWSKKADIDEETGEKKGEAVLCFIVGNRGGGKTVGVGLYTLADFINKGYQCALIRRNIKEFENSKTSTQAFWGKCLQYSEEMEGHKITYKNNIAYIDGKVFCYPLALTDVNNIKNETFENVHTLIFDEFIAESGKEIRLKGMNELQIIFSILDTVARRREKAKDTTAVIFLSNAITKNNIYFNELGIDKILRDDTKRIDREKESGYVLEQVYNENVEKEVLESAFGKILQATKSGREYLGYSQGNKFKDNKDFIIPKPKGQKKYLYTLIYNAFNFSVQFSEDCNFWFLSDKVDYTFPRRIALTKEDHTLNTSLINNTYKEAFRGLKKIYENGDLYFESFRLKKIWEEVYNRI